MASKRKTKTPRELLEGVEIRQGKAEPACLAETHSIAPPQIANAGDVVEWLNSEFRQWLYAAAALVEITDERRIAVCILLDMQHLLMAVVECLNTGELPAIRDVRDREAAGLVRAAKSLFEGELACLQKESVEIALLVQEVHAPRTRSVDGLDHEREAALAHDLPELIR